jgi:DNA polymerase-3 subunit epsilon
MWSFTRRQSAELPAPVQEYLAAEPPGERIPWRAVPYSVLDIETTGLHPRRDSVIAIGLIEIEQGRVRLDRQWYTLIRPATDTEVSVESIRIHGLLRHEVRQARHIREVLPELLAQLRGRVLIVHYAPIDIDFLSRALRVLWGIRLRGPAIDTMRLAQSIQHVERWTGSIDSQSQSITALRPLALQAGIPIHGEHNALGDAITTAQLFLAQATRLEKMGDGTLRHLLKAGRCLR